MRPGETDARIERRVGTKRVGNTGSDLSIVGVDGAVAAISGVPGYRSRVNYIALVIAVPAENRGFVADDVVETTVTLVIRKPGAWETRRSCWKSRQRWATAER